MRKLVFVLILLGCLALAVGCSSSSGSTPSGVPTGTSSNVLEIAVDGGPTASQAGGAIYPNGAFATATVCAPGSTSNCVTVDNLLVDTGSQGLRVLQSAVSSLNLPSVNINGSAAYDCASFVDGSFLWGQVQSANVVLAGETASSVPIQVISSSTANIPTSCSNGGINENSQSSLGANGILGVGLEPFDCGGGCDQSSGASTPPTGAYYTCSGTSCTPVFASCGSECSDSTGVQQVTNPVVAFPVDNNGVIVELPSVSGSTATVTGSLVFGIGTETDNQFSSSAELFTAACDKFDTSFEGTDFYIDPSSCTGPGSFIDSGSNGYFFVDVNNVLATCPSNSTAADFYCPTSLTSLSATVEDPVTMFPEVIDFSIDNAQTLFSSGDAADSTLGGPAAAGSGFDWGLPFFYGRNVYSAIDGQTVPSGLANAPWWAF
ncbi:MAG TPA: DUF3443 family protein [Terriglobales bacterium]|nr:DUF3443 family protein [Terriglobales bacterium]